MGSFGKDAPTGGPETPAGGGHTLESLQERARRVADYFRSGRPAEIIDAHENWFACIVFETIYNALHSLRTYIEDESEPDISWTNPWVEVAFPVDWDWDAEMFRMGLGETVLNPDDAEFVDRVVESTVDLLYALTLRELTHRAYFHKRGDRYEPYLPPEEVERLRGLEGEELRAAEQAIFQPVCWGGALVHDLGDPNTDRAAAARLESMLLPGGLTFTATQDDGTELKGVVVAQFHPLVVDEDKHRAYFPVVVGLGFFPPDALGQEPPPADPSTWSESDRRALWEQLLGEVDKVVRNLAAQKPPVPSQTQQTSETGTTETLPLPALALAVGPVPEERRPTFPLAFGHARADTEVLDFLRHVHKVRLPARKWSTLPSWFDLCDRERDRILAEEGDRAFEDLRKTTGDPEARGPLLKRRFRSNGETVVSLTAQAQRDLKVREGLGKGFRYVDRNDFAKEYFVRLFQAGSGFVEVGLSWFGMAGPWVEEWRKELERQTRAAEQDAQLDLFKELDAKRQAEVERLVARLHMLKDSRRLMEAVVGQVSKQGATEVRVPAVAFRELLNLRTDPNWKNRVEAGLQALRACDFMVDSFGTGTKVKAYGTFLAEWRYRGAGPGDHGEGDYFLAVRPTFLGCLQAFESDRRKLSSGTEVLRLDFGKKLTDEDKAAHGWGYDRKAKARRTAESRFVQFDAGRVFYHAAAGLSPYQENLADFLERELTLRAAPVSRALGDYARRKREQVSPRAPDAHAPRVYTRTDCPLLAEGTRYHAALGNFLRNPEAGRTLYGTRRRESATGGPHAEGLLAAMGYDLRPGGAVRERRRVVQAALEDLKAVVVDYLGGVVAARHGGRWLTLEEAAALNEADLMKRVRWFLFVPETWAADRRRKWEETTGYTATEDPREAEVARLAHRGQVPTSADADAVGLAGGPLRLRLQAARNERGLTTRQVAALFGVSHVTVQNWERGTDPDPEDGKVRGKPLPEELVPLLVRWVETGEAPTPEELATRRTRRSGVKAEGNDPVR